MLKSFLNCSILTSILFVLSFCGNAQKNFYYKPLQDNASLKDSLFTLFQKRYNADIAGLGGPNKKYYEEYYKDRFESISNFFSDSLILADSKLNNYLQSIYSEIKRNNSDVQKLEMRVMFSRAWWPNAACYGEGTIVFNIGLFNRLHNEAEVAFVLCHELAHQYFDHVNKAISRYVETLYSDEFQKELRKVKNTEYEKRKIVEQLGKSVSFDSRRHSRDFEAQADSMAVVWLSKTRFDLHASIDCLGLLDSVDKDKYNVDVKPRAVFDFQQFPFKANWEQRNNSFFDKMANASKNESKDLADSLKTHPDCSKRIELIKDFVDKYDNRGTKFLVNDSAYFVEVQTTLDYEILNYLFEHAPVSRSLFYTLQMLDSLPPNAYLVTNVGRCLNKIYDAQKDHTLGKIVDSPSPYYEENYDDFLKFIQQLRLQDVAALSYYYMQQYKEKFGADTEFAAVYSQSSRHFP